MVTVVVCAYNEEKNLPLTLNNIIGSAELAGRIPLDIIVVNDGSRDNTAGVIAEFEKRHSFIRSIQSAENQGIGAGVLNALKIAKYEKLMVLPGDNACSSYIIQTLLKNAYKADFLISYIINIEERSYKRAIISSLYSLIYQATFNLPIKYVNGAPLYPVSMLRQMDLKASRYSLFAEASTKLLRKGVTFMEIGDYIKINQTKTSALRWVNLKEVVRTFTRLLVDIFIKNPGEYSKTPRRVIEGIDFDVNELGLPLYNDSNSRLYQIPVAAPTNGSYTSLSR